MRYVIVGGSGFLGQYIVDLIYKKTLGGGGINCCIRYFTAQKSSP